MDDYNKESGLTYIPIQRFLNLIAALHNSYFSRFQIPPFQF
jgi:hypothetical protein